MTGAVFSLTHRTHSRLLCKDCENAVCKLSNIPCQFHRDSCSDKCTECSKSCCVPCRECTDKLFDEISSIACLIKLNIKDLKDSFQQEQSMRGCFTNEQRHMIRAIRDGYSKANAIAEILSNLDDGKSVANKVSIKPINAFGISRVMELMPETEAEFERYVRRERKLRYSSGRKKEKAEGKRSG